MPPVPAAVDSAIDVAKLFTAIMTTRASTICAAINQSPGTQLKPRDLRVLKDASERNLAESGARAVLLICIHALGLRLASIKHRMDTTPGADLPSVDHRTGTLLEHLLRVRNDLDGMARIPTTKDAIKSLARASRHAAQSGVSPSGDTNRTSAVQGTSCGLDADNAGQNGVISSSDPAREAARALRAARDLRKAQKLAAFQAKCAARTAAARAERAKQLAQAEAARAARAKA